MGRSRKEFLFGQGAAALNQLGVAGESYGCPICATLFSRTDLSNGMLTEEHVPQKAAGGRPLLLTCRVCNNFAGKTFETDYSSALRAAKKITAFSANTSDIGPVQLKVHDFTLNVVATRDKGTTHFLLPTKHNNPLSLEKLTTLLVKTGTALEIDVIIPHAFRKERVRLAELKSAFLACVAAFGYSYGLDKNLDFVRRQILDGTESSYRVNKIDLPTVPVGSILIDSDYKRFLVKFNGPAILLPTQHTDEMEFSRLVEARTPIVGAKYRRIPKSFEALLDYQGYSQAHFLS